MVLNAEGATKTFEMPRHAYMKLDPRQPGRGYLLFTPWNFAGLGGKPDEEYWVLGAQFLQNYYTMYDFKDKKIGLVESSTSTINDEIKLIKKDI